MEGEVQLRGWARAAVRALFAVDLGMLISVGFLRIRGFDRAGGSGTPLTGGRRAGGPWPRE